MEYASLAEVLQGNAIKTSTDSAWLQVLITAACKAIDNYCGRKEDGFKANGQPTAREFVGSGKSLQWIDEAARITQVEVKDSPTDTTYKLWDAGDWVAGRGDPKRGAFGDRDFRPYQWVITSLTGSFSVFTAGRAYALRGFSSDPERGSFGVPTVRVTANWGYSMDTPPEVKQAAIMQVGRWYMRGKSQMSDSTVTPEFGVTVFRRAVETLDQDIAMILVMGNLVRKSAP